MSGGAQSLLDRITINLRDHIRNEFREIYIDVYDNSLARKWLTALENLLVSGHMLEKHYCFFGFADSPRDGHYLCDRINDAISAVNNANIGYHIDDYFRFEDVIQDGPIGTDLPGRKLVQSRFNNLHRYFEDLQGVSGKMSKFYLRSDPVTRYHIRQLNLLCHEFESWALSYRKKVQAPEWQRPSQIMCWLNAPRFELEPEDFELFGIETLTRPTGGVFVGVNKAVGKHHWEVFQDEGRDSRIDELTTTTLKSQTEAAGDFDIEWAQDTSGSTFMIDNLQEFRGWLERNGFDPEDKNLTIGHPQVGQVDLPASFGTNDPQEIWSHLARFQDVYSIHTSHAQAEYLYHWSDRDYIQRQVERITKGN